MAVKNKNLKWGVFSSPSVKETFERYVIENVSDLKAYETAFPELKRVGMNTSMKKCLSEGKIVLATDRHPLSGFPTWCLESKYSTHPSSINRIKLG